MGTQAALTVGPPEQIAAAAGVACAPAGSVVAASAVAVLVEVVSAASVRAKKDEMADLEERVCRAGLRIKGI